LDEEAKNLAIEENEKTREDEQIEKQVSTPE
jgi:hypothetical protein